MEMFIALYLKGLPWPVSEYNVSMAVFACRILSHESDPKPDESAVRKAIQSMGSQIVRREGDGIRLTEKGERWAGAIEDQWYAD